MFCSTGSIYGYQGQRPLTEADPPGVPLRANYSFSKIAAESVCTWVAEQYGIPLTIIRICSTYGPQGGAPADRFEMMLAHKPIRLHPDAPNNYNPIYEDDYVELGIRAMEVAATPPIVVNWAGSETVSVEDYCTYMGELVGVEPSLRLHRRGAHAALARRHLHAPGTRTDEDALARGLPPDDRSTPSGNRPRRPRFANTRGSALMRLPGTPSDEVADDPRQRKR